MEALHFEQTVFMFDPQFSLWLARLGDPVTPHSCPQIQDVLAPGAEVKSTLHLGHRRTIAATKSISAGTIR
jgi:hypothetical protein